jgi:hypothetical protein
MIGLEYAKYLGVNGRSIHKNVTEFQRQLEMRFKVSGDERYWAAAITVILSAAKIVNAQKWATININDLYDFLLREFFRMRGKKNRSPTDYTKEDALIVALAHYLSVNRTNNTIILNKLWLTRGRPPVGAIEMEGKGTSREHQIREINVAIGLENKMIRFTDSSLGKYCRENDIPTSAIREGLSNLLGANRTNSRITSGLLDMKSGTEPCWLLKLEGTQYEMKFGF